MEGARSVDCKYPLGLTLENHISRNIMLINKLFHKINYGLISQITA